MSSPYNIDEKEQNKTKQNTIAGQAHYLCGICMFLQCQHGFSLGALFFMHAPKMCMWGELAIYTVPVWMTVDVNECALG